VASSFRIYGLPLRVPRPGSPEALGRGCTCPDAANRKGKGWEVSEESTRTGFWIETTCRLHGVESREERSAPG